MSNKSVRIFAVIGHSDAASSKLLDANHLKAWLVKKRAHLVKPVVFGKRLDGWFAYRGSLCTGSIFASIVPMRYGKE